MGVSLTELITVLLFSPVWRLRRRGLPGPHLPLLGELRPGPGLGAGEEDLREPQEAHVSISVFRTLLPGHLSTEL